MLYDDYIQYYNLYRAQYGEKTVLFMEVGSFFECYAVETETVQEGINMSEICSLLNIQSTKKNKSIPQVSRTNPLMCGFPSGSLKKYMEILLQEQYTIILVEQVTPPPNPERKVTQIISPSTYIETNQVASLYLMCLCLHPGYDRVKRESYTYLSVSFSDMSTGQVLIIDENVYGDEHTIIQECSRMVTSYSPKEIVLISEERVMDSMLDSARLWLQQQTCCIHDHTSMNLNSYQQIVFQNAILKKVYEDTGIISPIEFIQLEKNPNAVTCFVYLIQFLFQHDETLIKRLSRPTLLYTKQRLRVTSTALEQLNITQKPGVDSSLVKMLNTCQTAMGKRLFTNILVSPLTNKDDIQQRYDWIHHLIDEKRYLTFRPFLQSMKDMERLYRRILLQSCQPSEMVLFISGLEQAYQLSKHASSQGFSFPSWTIDQEINMETWLQHSTKWDMDKMATCTSSYCINFYKEHPVLSALEEKVEQLHLFFRNYIKKANAVSDETDSFKMEVSDRGEYQITITKRRYEMYIKKGRGPSFVAQPLSANNKTMMKLTFNGFHEKQQELIQSIQELRASVLELYLEDITLYASYSSLMELLITFISNIDVWCTSAKNAIQFNYVKPELEDSLISGIKTNALRHPLIEKQDVVYIPNDITLNGNHSMLLHGINAVGKSSLMKSIGIAVIMAQSGMYVPASSFTYTPYTQLFTRIPCGDNLFKGQSTFVAEMLDIKTILKHADSRSLVIGDELCSGTETVSAISIVSAGIMTLAGRKSSFIFATHLFEVSQLEAIQNLEQVKIYHMAVHFDENRKILIYDRLLREGPGISLYGLEVCRSLDMDNSFLLLVNSIRQSYMDIHLIQNKKSLYSKNKIVDICSICNKTAVETHHIKEQHLADENGFVDHRHKNHTSNLISVCTSCHDSIHANKIKVNGYESTSKGIQLSISMIDKTQEKPQPKDDVYKSMIDAYLKAGKSIAWISKELGITQYKINKLRG